jgi:hypothetical protein
MKHIFYTLPLSIALISHGQSINYHIAEFFSEETGMTCEELLDAYNKIRYKGTIQEFLSSEEKPEKFSPNLEKIKKILDERASLIRPTMALMNLLRRNINPTSETPLPAMEADILHYAASSQSDFLAFILTLGFMPADTTTEQAEEMAEKIFGSMRYFNSINRTWHSKGDKKTYEQTKSIVKAMHTLLKDPLFLHFPEILSKTYSYFMREIPTLSDTDIQSLAVVHNCDQHMEILLLTGIFSNNDPIFQLITVLIMRIQEKPISIKKIQEIQEKLPPNTSLTSVISMLLDNEISHPFLNNITEEVFADYFYYLIHYLDITKDYQAILATLKTLDEIIKHERMESHIVVPYSPKFAKLNEEQFKLLASFIAILPLNEKS